MLTARSGEDEDGVPDGTKRRRVSKTTSDDLPASQADMFQLNPSPALSESGTSRASRGSKRSVADALEGEEGEEAETNGEEAVGREVSHGRKSRRTRPNDGEGSSSGGSGMGVALKRGRAGKGKAKEGEAGWSSEEDAVDEDEQRRGEDLSQQFDGDGTQEKGATTEFAECGIIDKVEVRNFLCHRHLEVELGPNLNFINGKNGSGKSAILTAIVIGLGGRVTQTSRGTSLKDLIRKKSKEGAVISLTLRNAGEDAYRHEAYGNKIIVERRINREGGGSYKIKNARGKVVSTTKSEVDSITDFFNVQVDNPIAVMNQDLAKSFITASSTQQKYKLFYKATQLEQMAEDYKRVKESLRVIDQTMVARDKQIKVMAEEVAVAERKATRSKNLKELERQLEAMKNEMVWAQIHEKEMYEGELQADLKQVVANAEKAQGKRDELSGQREKAQQALDAATQALETVNAEAIQEQAACQEQFALLREHKATRSKKKNAVKLNKRMLSDAQKERDQLDRQIETLKNKASHDRQAEIEARQREIDEQEEQLAAANTQAEKEALKLASLRDTAKKLKDREYESRSNIKRLEGQMRSIKQELNQLRCSKKDRINMFGSYMSKLKDAIAREKRWHKPPLGPLGLYIRLKDDRWGQAIDRAIGHTLSSFCVNDNHDFLLMRSIFRAVLRGRNEKWPTVVQLEIADKELAGFRRDIPNARAPDGTKYPTVLDLLEVEHPHILNRLVDACSAHQTILIGESPEARDFLYGDRGRNAGKIASVYTGDGDVLKPGKSGRYFSNKQPKTSNRLSVNVEAHTERREADLAAFEVQVREEKENGKGIQRAQAATSKDLEKRAAEERKLRQASARIEAVIVRLKRAPGLHDDTADDNNVQDLEAELSQFQDSIAEIETQVQQATQDWEAYDKEFQGHQQQAGEAEKILAARQVKLDEAQNGREKAEVLRHKILGKLQRCEAALAESQQQAVELEGQVAELRGTIDHLRTQAANSHFEEVATRRSPKEIDGAMAANQKQLAAARQKSGGTYEEILRDWKEKKDSFSKTTATMDELREFHKLLDEARVQREGQFHTWRKSVGTRAVYLFGMLLNEKGFNGHMELDHKNGTLDLKIQVNEKTTAKTAEALSGGERSFSTVAFIIALWETMECPFRCLDEFDVHMDMMNRRISLKMLIRLTGIQSTRQFIFLTPQNLANEIDSTENVKVLTLKDPIRNQPTLDEYVGDDAAAAAN